MRCHPLIICALIIGECCADTRILEGKEEMLSVIIPQRLRGCLSTMADPFLLISHFHLYIPGEQMRILEWSMVLCLSPKFG